MTRERNFTKIKSRANQRKSPIIWTTLYTTGFMQEVTPGNLFKSPFVHSAERRNNYRTF